MYEKIVSQLESGYRLSHREFENFEQFLLDDLHQNPLEYRVNHELAALYYSHGNQLRTLAVSYAKKALELQPNSQFDINIINNASDGVLTDWDTGSHYQLIDYYQKTLKTTPENKRLYWYLLDNLLADGRIREAKDVLSESYVQNPDSLNDFYNVYIEEKEKGFSQVKENYLILANQYSDDWRILFSIANELCRNEEYRSAIPIWEKAFEAQEKPRYTDYYESIALCYTFLGEPENAVKSYRKVLEVLRDEWGLRFSAYIERIKEKIDRLS
ncbi:tetratricopeptide repeat protein [Streptococcus sp. S784/96/1]|uniref:tetratricopeptide repeat protein n=1 Tax=Streptococcus sp. S784/96/1 TaxID=2653499 RepID=UPI001EE4BBB2|nr:transcriptional regulator [Streptococcus sp. S784/96/1]